MNKRYIVILSVLLIGIAFLSCSNNDKTETIPQYEGWETYTYKHFVYHFTPMNYWGRNIDRFASGMERYLEENCQFMAMDLPTDTIHYFIHDSYEAGVELTGRELPYHTDRQIHWGRISPFGLELARYLVDKWGIRKTDFDFLAEGLVTLRDYSGLDYHHHTAFLIEAKKLIPLDSLADNEVFHRLMNINSNMDSTGSGVRIDPQTPQHLGWESASFVAFITYNYGINRFKMLWQSTASFEKSIRELFETDLKTFEDNWLKFAMEYYRGTTRGENLMDNTSDNK